MQTLSIQYLKDKGNSAVFVKVRNPENGFLLNFDTLEFISSDTEQTNFYLNEYSTSDTYESVYANQAELPVGDFIVEFYAEGLLIGISSSYVSSKAGDAMSLVPSLTDTINNTNENILTKTDSRLDNLDIPISSRISAGEILQEAYAQKGDNPTLSEILFMIWGMLSEKQKTGATEISVKKLDGDTVAMTFSLNNQSLPTAITRSS